MGRFFIGREYHDAMYGDDGQLVPGLGHKSKEELERLSHSLFDAGWPSVKHKQVTKERVCDIELPPVVKITQYEYEYLKRRSKRLEILERAFLECRREEVNDYPTCSFIPDKNSREDK